MRDHRQQISIWFSGLLALAATSSTTIQLRSTPADAQGPIVDPSFPGFAFEQASFYNYAFDESGQPNTFSQNLIKSVLDRTGGTPLLRVGGTSGDHGHYDAAQKEPVSCASNACGPFIPQDKALGVGPSYFEAFKQFPGAQFEFMVPFDRRNLDNALEWTTAGLNAIGKSLYAVEIGNEPNFYNWWNPKEYLDEYMKFADAIVRQHPGLAGKRIFQALDVASGCAEQLSTEEAFEKKLDKNATSIKQIAYHYYQGMAPASYKELQESILHSNTVKLLGVFEDDIKYLQTKQKDVGFVLSEVGDNLGQRNRDLAYRNSLATALWAVDFQLQAMTIGVNRVNFQQIYKPGFCMWEPVNSSQWGVPEPLVRPNYYSQPFVADFIGKGGNTKVASILSDSDMAAYAAYEGDKLARIAIINLSLWTEGDGDRKTTNIVLDGLPTGTTSVTVNQLNSPSGAMAQTDLTYAGLQWTYESNGLQKQVTDDSKKIDVKDGKVTVSIEQASALMLEF